MLGDSGERADCFGDLGVEVDSRCELIDDEKERETCYIFRRKLGYNASETCDVLDGYERSFCYNELGILQNKPDYCNYWTDDYLRYKCIGEVAGEAGDIGLCDFIPEDGKLLIDSGLDLDDKLMKEFCYVSVAVTTPLESKDTSPCDRISDIELQTYCRALVLNDHSLCMQIKDGFRSNRCTDDITKVQSFRSQRNLYLPERPGMAYQAIYVVNIYENEARLW